MPCGDDRTVGAELDVEVLTPHADVAQPRPAVVPALGGGPDPDGEVEEHSQGPFTAGHAIPRALPTHHASTGPAEVVVAGNRGPGRAGTGPGRRAAFLTSGCRLARAAVVPLASARGTATAARFILFCYG